MANYTEKSSLQHPMHCFFSLQLLHSQYHASARCLWTWTRQPTSNSMKPHAIQFLRSEIPPAPLCRYMMMIGKYPSRRNLFTFIWTYFSRHFQNPGLLDFRSHRDNHLVRGVLQKRIVRMLGGSFIRKETVRSWEARLADEGWSSSRPHYFRRDKSKPRHGKHSSREFDP